MKYLSVCSGIEAASVAWKPLGWEAVGFSEIEKFPSQVLAHHYPDVPNFGDMTKYKEWNLDTVNLLVGGTPCQSFSVAGLRKGLEDPRGNLMLTYCGLLDWFRPQWFVWENVPGVLSSNGGRDFGSFLGALAELGYGFAYRVLDAQYFGVAQRRRRVFVVGHFGDWRPAARALFESESLRGDSPPSREARQETSVFTPSSIGGYRSGAGTLRASGGDLGGGSEHLIAQPVYEVHHQDARVKEANGVCQTMTSRWGTGRGNVPLTYGIPGNWIGRKPENGGNAVEPMNNIAPCLTKADQHGVAHPIAMRESGQGYWMEDDKAGTLRAEGENRPSRPSHVIAQPIALAENTIGRQHMAVRRLSPVECERLQGFPDHYTDIKPNGKATPHSPRYKALGNSMAVPVMAWIGQRIQQVENEK